MKSPCTPAVRKPRSGEGSDFFKGFTLNPLRCVPHGCNESPLKHVEVGVTQVHRVCPATSTQLGVRLRPGAAWPSALLPPRTCWLSRAGRNKGPGRVRGHSQEGCLTPAPCPPQATPTRLHQRLAVSVSVSLCVSWSLSLFLRSLSVPPTLPGCWSLCISVCDALSTCPRSPPAARSPSSNSFSLSHSLCSLSLPPSLLSSLSSSPHRLRQPSDKTRG